MAKKGGSSQAPAAPDPYKTASTEAQFNRLDTYGPSGSGQRYGYTNAQGKFVQGLPPQGYQSAVTTVESDLDRSLRSILEPASLDLTRRVVTDNITNMPNAPRVQDRGTVANDIFNRNLSMMMPEITRGETRLLTNLQSRGLPLGSDAFTEAYGAQQRQTQDTVSRLAQDANVAAGQEQSRLFSLDSASRSGAVAELVAAMGGGYNPPSSVPSGAAPSVNYSNLANSKYQADLSQYNADRQQKSNTASALGSMGASLLMKCAEAAKDVEGVLNIGWAAERLAGLDLKVWSYKPGEGPDGDTARHIGPMAEQFHALTGLGDGRSISVIDMLGMMAAAFQFSIHQIRTLQARVTELEERAVIEDAQAESREAHILRKVS